MSRSPDIMRRIRDRLLTQFDAEHPQQARKIPGRMRILHAGRFHTAVPEPGEPLQRLVLYGRVVRAQLRELAKDKPNWRLLCAQKHWMQLLEAAHEQRLAKRSCATTQS